MPWRARYITTRRHPYAIGCYAMLLALGVLIASNVLDSSLITAAVGVGWQDAWELLLLIGGTGGLAGVLWPEKRLDDAMAVEMAGAIACTAGLLVYAIADVIALGWGSPGWVLFGILAAASGCRACQCKLEMHRLDDLASQLTDARTSAALRDQEK